MRRGTETFSYLISMGSRQRSLFQDAARTQLLFNKYDLAVKVIDHPKLTFHPFITPLPPVMTFFKSTQPALEFHRGEEFHPTEARCGRGLECQKQNKTTNKNTILTVQLVWRPAIVCFFLN